MQYYSIAASYLFLAHAVNSICSSYLVVSSCQLYWSSTFVGDQQVATASGVCTHCGDVAAAVAAVE